MKKKIFMLTVIAVLVLTVSLFAQVPKAERQARPGRMAKLDLTDEQQSKMQDMQLALQKEILPLTSKIRAIDDEIKQEMVAEKFNASKVKSLIEQKEKFRTEIQIKRTLNRRAVRDMLTPEQQKEFDLRALSRGMERGPRGKASRPGRPMRMVPPIPEEGPESPRPDLEN